MAVMESIVAVRSAELRPPQDGVAAISLLVGAANEECKMMTPVMKTESFDILSWADKEIEWSKGQGLAQKKKFTLASVSLFVWLQAIWRLASLINYGDGHIYCC
ncbi:hypothetical protein HN51_048609 [Arachis hypogaea]